MSTAQDKRAREREAERRYRENNLEKVRATQAESKRRARARDPEAARAYQRAHYAKRREHIRALAKARYQKNAEKERAYSQKYRERNRKRANAVVREWRKNNPEKAKAVGKSWATRNPDAVRAIRRRRRALVSGAPINDFTATEWLVLQVCFGHRCAYCDAHKRGELTQDHIVPLSKGGAHTLSNIVPACKSCNSKKHDGPPLRPVTPLVLPYTTTTTNPSAVGPVPL